MGWQFGSGASDIVVGGRDRVGARTLYYTTEEQRAGLHPEEPWHPITKRFLDLAVLRDYLLMALK